MPELGEGWSAETKAASRAGEGDWTGPAAAMAAAAREVRQRWTSGWAAPHDF